MSQSKVVLFVVGAVGIAAGYLIHDFTENPGSASPVSRNLQITATIPESEVQVLRESGFEEIDSIAEVLQLPTSFARLEATFALAGRSTGSEVQQLLFDAAEISEPLERQAMARALFARLTEIDPSAALSTARVAPFSSSRAAEDYVWQHWARLDLYSAIEAAANEPSATKRNHIAQTLYRAVGFVDTPEAGLIQDMLGIPPNKNTVARYVIELSDESPAVAVAYINDNAPAMKQTHYASRLGTHLAKSEMYIAGQYTSLFVNNQARRAYEKSIKSAEATLDPIATLDRLLARATYGSNQQELFRAMGAVVESDLDTAIEYFERTENTPIRQYFGAMIAKELATKDLDEALYWARQHDVGINKGLESAVLSVMAQADPDRALAEISQLLQSESGFEPASQALMAISQMDPEKGMRFLSGPDAAPIRPNMKAQFQSMLYQQWVRSEPNDAIEWALSQGEAEAERYLSNAAMIAHQDVEMAKQVLPRLPEAVARNWRQQIVGSLANNRSPEEALAFARAYSDQPDYDEMLTNIAVVSAVRDPETALSIASRVTDDRNRDQAFSAIVNNISRSDARLASSYLDNITDENSKMQAANTVIASWYGQNSTEAVAWIQSHPAGKQRDAMVGMLSGYLMDPSPAEQQLIDSVADDSIRMQIESRRIMTISHSDPVKARRMLESSSMPEEQKLAIEQFLDQSNRPSMHIYN